MTRLIGATYRLQLRNGMALRDATALVPYLHGLGVTHLYVSPILKARRGSSHGYDVTDPTRLDPALGTEDDLRALSAALGARDMGLVLDVVPNHMAAGMENPWWEDVLENGRSSPRSGWFDIDWRSPGREPPHRILIPALGDRRVRALARGEIRVSLEDDHLRIRYFGQTFPMDPATVPDVLRSLVAQEGDAGGSREDHATLGRILDRLAALPGHGVRRPRLAERRAREGKSALADLAALLHHAPALREKVRAAAEAFGLGSGGTQRLSRLLAEQPYALVHWRRASHEINYRRFFDVNDLVALRMEDPEVFAAVHKTVLGWVREGFLDGLRIDHVDGLLDPRGYLDRLATAATPPGETTAPALFVEKILAGDETLRASWPVAGTTGYEFLGHADAIFLDPPGAGEIESLYGRLLDRTVRFREVALLGRRRALDGPLAGQARALGGMLQRIARRNPRTASIPAGALVEALVEVMTGLRVYRTYVDGRPEGSDAEDRRRMDEALAVARARGRARPGALALVVEVLGLEGASALSPEEARERLRFVQGFQQLSPPVAAKGVEDTALYLYGPLLSRNDVGTEPDAPLGEAVAALHAQNEWRAAHRPGSLLCVSTHDTKRSADLRARLHALSEAPALWSGFVTRWRRRHRPIRSRVGFRWVPEAHMEYVLYQTLVGIWPAAAPGSPAIGKDDLAALRDRVEAYAIKAARESKAHTSWTRPDGAYESALTDFVRTILDPAQGRAFVEDLGRMVGVIARSGFWNALSRTLIHLTAPGVPDLYQGDELWSLTLVDPDNRRPVDFASRIAQAAALDEAEKGGPRTLGALARRLAADPFDGRIKLHVIRRALAARGRRPALFARGGYHPLTAEGSRGAHVFAFRRHLGTQAAVAIAPRLTRSLPSGPEGVPAGPEAWGDTRLPLPEGAPGGNLVDVMTGRRHVLAPQGRGPALRLAEVLSEFPVALLLTEEVVGEEGALPDKAFLG